MEDDAKCVSRAADDAADAVAEIDAIVAARAFDGAVAGREHDGLALAGGNDFCFGLRAGLLLDENKFAAIPIAARLAHQENHLQGEGNFAVKILMQTVVAACFVVEDQRSGFDLSGFVADFQESRMVGRIKRARFSERPGPLVCDVGQVRVSTGAKAGDDFRQRVREILVVADSETVAFHDDVAAEAGRFAIEGDNGFTFGRRKKRGCYCVAARSERFAQCSPI